MENKAVPKWVSIMAHIISGAILFAGCATALGLAFFAIQFLGKALRGL